MVVHQAFVVRAFGTQAFAAQAFAVQAFQVEILVEGILERVGTQGTPDFVDLGTFSNYTKK